MMVPRRAVARGFDATEKLILPSPCPSAPAVSVIHATSARALHVHSRFAPTFTCPVPPDAAKALGIWLTVTAHRAEVGPVMLVEDEDEPQEATAKRAAAHASVRPYARIDSRVEPGGIRRE